ncbi:YcaO-like family protein [Nocardiopsis sp. FIRDI 009]|uniref:YcaO-like family protein n=1 Tax=Nocardiopsis sp. FIRDI 009 TaxID=714197 RepID=UPI000E26616A|nr:YcaO-like family protein [Nocardiopsis sp. FIRDI 009]
MIDVTRTLGPAGEITRLLALTPPRLPDNPLWGAGVELHPPPGMTAEDTPLSARMVGAHGHSRSDALLRGSGEAVERFALHPVPGLVPVRGRAADLPHPALHFHGDGIGLGDPAAADADLTWYEGRRLRDSAPVMVPAPLVDWPADPVESVHFDPGPSGAAAGSTPEMALRSALLEVLERDAITVAWERGLRLPSFTDPDEIAPADARSGGTRSALMSLWTLARGEGLAPALARLPTAVPEVWCFVAALVGSARPGALATVGLKVSDRPWEALLGAFQEAWQVRTALDLSRSAFGANGLDGPITNEDERIQYLLTEEGYASVRDWVGGFVPGERPEPPGPVDCDRLLQGILADGGDPVAVDLTPRLPEPLRRMGWCAVKVIPVGYQHLRMDERPSWSWNRVRLDSAVERTGCEARHSGTPSGRPHPLP